MNNPVALLDNPSELNTPRPLQWLARSKVMAVVWTAMRVWLGVMWIQAGASKLWGAENSACRLSSSTTSKSATSVSASSTDVLASSASLGTKSAITQEPASSAHLGRDRCRLGLS